MADIIKITSPVSIKSKVQNLPTRLPTDAVFDIANPNPSLLDEIKPIKEPDQESGKQSLLKNLNKEIFEPLLNSTKTQAEGVRKLVLMAKLFETSPGALPDTFLDKVFVKPQEMLGELLTQEKGATIFRGEFFDSLRMLAKLEGQPRLKEAVVSVLKYFDSFVNQENSLNAIVKQGQALVKLLPKTEAPILQQQIETLENMVKLFSKANQGGAMEKQTELKSFLKNEIIPFLGKIAKQHQGSERIYNKEMTIVHNIVRYDKADPKRLEEAVYQLGDELKKLTNLTEEDIGDMKKLVFEHAKEQQDLVQKPILEKKAMEKVGVPAEESDITALLTKALDKEGPAKVSGVAQNLLFNMIQNESPIIPFLHFTIPFRYMDENTYGEFFVDKDSKGKKGDGKQAQTIFFTIQSDKYGNFEVEVVAREKRIDLDIRCPDMLLGSVKDTKAKIRDIIEEQGFRLANYQVGVYQESQSIMQKFPKLAMRKVGIDVKV